MWASIRSLALSWIILGVGSASSTFYIKAEKNQREIIGMKAHLIRKYTSPISDLKV